MLVKMNLREFLDKLASKSPAPGGGSVAAQSGATGAALLSMVCNLTIGKEKYKEVEADMMSLHEKLEGLRSELIDLIDKDTDAYNAVVAAFKHPKETDEEKAGRKQAIADAMKIAAEVPMETAQKCYAVMLLADEVLAKGNPNAMSDCAVGVSCASTGLQSAIFNVMINLPSVKDEDFVVTAKANIAKMKSESSEILHRILGKVEQELS